MFESWSKVTQILLVLLFNGQESPFGEYGKEAGFKSQCGGGEQSTDLLGPLLTLSEGYVLLLQKLHPHLQLPLSG